MPKNILVTGATGLVGKQLVQALLASGHRVHILSRRQQPVSGAKVFLWDVPNAYVDEAAFNGIETIVHLAGEGIAAQRWTPKRKQELIDSRVASANLLYDTIARLQSPVKDFISASAVGYYGNRGDENLREDSASGEGFMADCCVAWERAADRGIPLGMRVAKIRIGFILSPNGGALTSMDKPIRYFVGAPLGTGKQWIPWIHIDDIVGIFKIAVEDEKFSGIFNASAPNPVSNAALVKCIAHQLKRPVWPVKVPAFVLKTLLGEMAEVVLISNNTSAQKLLDFGYQFRFVNLDDALTHIYQS